MCFSKFFVQAWHKFRDVDCCIVSAGKWFIPRRALIRFAPAVPPCRSLNTVNSVRNPFYSILRCWHRSRVQLSAGSYHDLVNWYRSLLTRRTVCGRAAGNPPRTQKQAEWNETRNCTNSALALQDHCSYKAPTTNHHIKKYIYSTVYVLYGSTFLHSYIRTVCGTVCCT